MKNRIVNIWIWDTIKSFEYYKQNICSAYQFQGSLQSLSIKKSIIDVNGRGHLPSNPFFMHQLSYSLSLFYYFRIFNIGCLNLKSIFPNIMKLETWIDDICRNTITLIFIEFPQRFLFFQIDLLFTFSWHLLSIHVWAYQQMCEQADISFNRFARELLMFRFQGVPQIVRLFGKTKSSYLKKKHTIKGLTNLNNYFGLHACLSFRTYVRWCVCKVRTLVHAYVTL